MIQQQTKLKVSDNSGAKIAKCIKVLGGFKRKFAKIGDIIIVSVQKLRPRGKKDLKIKKGEVHKALIIRTKTFYKKKDRGFRICFKENSIILLNKNEAPIGTRILGPLSQVFRKKKLQKFISISSGLI